jgi:hypothetical protein
MYLPVDGGCEYNDPSLSQLIVSAGTLSPAFDPSTTS